MQLYNKVLYQILQYMATLMELGLLDRADRILALLVS